MRISVLRMLVWGCLLLNSKGNYPLALAITVFVCCIWLIVSFGSLYAGVSDSFGVVQCSVLGLSADMRMVESQLKLVSSYAVDDALREKKQASTETQQSSYQQ